MRWQISVGKYDEAEKTLVKIANSNDKPLSGPFFSSDFKKEQVSTYIRKENSGICRNQEKDDEGRGGAADGGTEMEEGRVEGGDYVMTLAVPRAVD